MKYTKEILEEAVKHSFSISGVLRQLGIAGGGSHGHITKRIKELGIDTSHFKQSAQSLKGLNPQKPFQEILVLSSRNQRTQTFQVRRALMEIGREYKCENNKCLVQTEWLGKKLVLDIDHINENWQDNRQDNLRFLCPNCHRQTENYGSKRREPEANNYIAYQNKRVPHMKARKLSVPLKRS
ncbi:MAG: HNH endonuclease [Cyanobacteriota bacterium]|nr:HNH endonuclease [Cyanobacteriota bacterium]